MIWLHCQLPQTVSFYSDIILFGKLLYLMVLFHLSLTPMVHVITSLHTFAFCWEFSIAGTWVLNFLKIRWSNKVSIVNGGEGKAGSTTQRDVLNCRN